jgi:Zn ribbon nucleic-acid-binding protein
MPVGRVEQAFISASTSSDVNTSGGRRRFGRTNLAAIADACPNCGERDHDRLVWIDDETVRCTMCGTQYHPRDDRNALSMHE